METLQRTANRGSISTGFDIDYSLKNESDNGERFQSPNLGTPTSVRTFTFSMWVKRTELAANGSQPYILNFQANTGISVYLQFAADSSTDSIYYLFQNSSVQAYGKTKAVFRDTSAWMHIVWRVDTTQSTATDRVRIYVNGVDQEIESGGGGHPAHPDQNYDVPLQTTQYLLGYDGGNNGFCGYAAEYLYSDGQSLAPTEFGETDSDTGIWIPKDVSGTTFGNAGYYLDFADSSALGKDVGNSKSNFSHYGGSAADQATDTPTNNFATINVIWGTDRMPLISEGATEFGNNVNAYRYAPATMGVTSGKWYWEIKPTVNGNTLVSGGIASNQTTLFFYQETGNFVYHYDGNKYVNGGSSSYGAAWATNDIIGFAYDADNWTLTCYVNNSSQGNLLASQTDISSEIFIPYVYSFGTHTYQSNFGGYTTMSNTHTNTDENGYGSFVYAPPSGYYALCTKNLAEYG